MKEQYVGDINDYRKYALLRRLQVESGLCFGVCWMLTPSDGSADGNKTAYLSQPKHGRHDPEVYALLRSVRDDPDASRLRLIEDSGIIPGASYCNAIVPDQIAARKTWFVRASSRLADTDLIFFDPDNGLDVPSKAKGLKGSSKYLYRDEVVATYAAGHSLLIYQHHPHKALTAFYASLSHELSVAPSGAEVWVFRTPHVAFLLLIQPSHHAALHPTARSVSRFDPKFLTAERHHPTA